jgi:hypothetical protein
MPLPKQQFLSALGTPLVGGKVYTYAAGTSNPKATYTDAAGTIAQANPIQLNVRGEPANPIYWSGNYRVEVRDLLDNLVYTVDNYNTDPAGVWGLLTQLAAAVGSGLLGFIAAGAKAVKRTLLDKARERITVQDYMTDDQRADVANRVGSLDVSDAIQAAIDALGPNGGTIEFLPGVYLVGKTINITGKPNVHLRGVGYSGSWTTSTLGSTLKAAATTLDVLFFSAFSYNCTVEGLHITGGARAIHFDTCLSFHVYGVNLRENQIGLEVYGNGVGVIRDCMIRDNTTYGIYLARQSGDTDIFSCDIGNNKIGLLISTGGVRVFGGSIFSAEYGGAGVGVQIDTTTSSHDDVIRNVKFYGVLIGANATQVKIIGNSLAERTVQDVEFHACHIHQANDGGENFNPAFAWGYGVYIANALKGVRFIDCDFIGCRDYAIKAVNCLDGITVRGGSIRNGNADGIVFDLVQWARVSEVDFINNTGTALKMLCSNAGDMTQNNRFGNCNFRSGGAFYSEDARTRANFHHNHLGPNLGSFALNNVTPLTQIINPAQAGNQLSLKNQTLYLDGAAWNGSRLILGSYNFWVDGTGRLRIKSSPPISDTDGTVVGTQA